MGSFFFFLFSLARYDLEYVGIGGFGAISQFGGGRGGGDCILFALILFLNYFSS